MAIKSLGDLTPTAMLRKMRRLRPCEEQETLLFRLGFLRILPTNNILVVLEDAPLDELAKKVDRILEQKNDAPDSVSAIRGDFSPVPPSSFSFMVGEVDAVRQLLRNSRSSGASAAPPSRSHRSENFVCGSHSKWGSKAYSCKPGCLFSDISLNKRLGNSNAGC